MKVIIKGSSYHWAELHRLHSKLHLTCHVTHFWFRLFLWQHIQTCLLSSGILERKGGERGRYKEAACTLRISRINEGSNTGRQYFLWWFDTKYFSNNMYHASDYNSQWSFALQGQQQAQAQAQRASPPQILIGCWGCRSLQQFPKYSEQRELSMLKKAEKFAWIDNVQ